MVGCLSNTPHIAYPISLRKSVGKGVASPHFVCVFEIFGKGDDRFILFMKGVRGLAMFSIFTKHGVTILLTSSLLILHTT